MAAYVFTDHLFSVLVVLSAVPLLCVWIVSSGRKLRGTSASHRPAPDVPRSGSGSSMPFARRVPSTPQSRTPNRDTPNV